MHYTLKQKRYISVFMRQIDVVLDHFMETGHGIEKFGESVDAALAYTTSAVDVATAAVVVAGLATAIPTAGTGLAVAGACIVILQTSNTCAKFVRRQMHDAHHPFVPDETRHDEIRLSLMILLREVAYLTAVRYRHFIDEVLEEKSVTDFAHYGAERIIKKLANDLKSLTDLPSVDMAPSLVDYLLESIKLSAIHESRKVSVNAAYRHSSLWASTVAYTKWGYARPRHVVYTKTAPYTLDYVFYASSNEQRFLKKDTTLLDYGYITVPPAQLHSKTCAINMTTLTPLRDADLIDKPKLRDTLSVYYPVSRDEVQQYLDRVRTNSLPDQSLNDFLYSRLSTHVVAECHDGELAGLDLRGGNFSEVNFRKAQLIGCDLRSTQWRDAHLEYAQLGGTTSSYSDMSHSDFQGVYAERSEWSNLLLTGNFTHARMNGAKIKNCKISPALLQMGSDWALVELENVQVDDPMQTLTQKFERQLTIEYQERAALNKAIVAVTEQCESCMQQVIRAQKAPSVDEGKHIAYMSQVLMTLTERQSQMMSEVDVRLMDINSQYALLNASINDVSTQQELIVEQLQQMLHEQHYQYEVQRSTNHQFSSRLTALEPVQELLQRLQQLWETEIDTPAFRKIRSSYIELQAAALHSTEQNGMALSDRLEQFYHDDSPYLLVHGEVGSGKSLTANLWQEELMHRYQTVNDWLPIYIKLKRIRDEDTENFLSAALLSIFNDSQIYTLKKYFKCLIIFDGLDECSLIEQRFVLEECAALNYQWEIAPPKILLLSQTRYLFEKDYHALLRISPEIIFPTEAECIIQAFNDEQIESYISLYQTQDAHFYARYASFQEQESPIRSMARSPIMLHIICEVLQTLAPGQTLPSSRLAFYDAFFLSWFQHVKRKLPDSTVDYKDFQYHIEELAMSMFEAGQDFVERPYPQRSHVSLKKAHRDQKRKEKREEEHQNVHRPNPIVALFEDPLFRKTHHLTPLSMTLRTKESVGLTRKGPYQVLRYEFTHLSFEHYALANRLLKILLSPDLDLDSEASEELDEYSDSGYESNLDLERLQENRTSGWNHGFLTESPSVLDFLYELLATHPEKEALQTRLLEMVYASKGEVGKINECAASNAISVLNKLRFDFSHNLSKSELAGIHIAKADLTRALLAYVDLSDSDLSDVCLNEAVLVRCKMHGALLTKTRFLSALSFVYTDTYPETFAISPSLMDDRFAYDIASDSYTRNNSIAIARTGDGEILMQLKGHKDKIRCMAWIVSGNYDRLASAGEGRTIRVWNMTNTGPTGQEIAKLKGHKLAILSLAWGQDGNLLASSSEDRTVQLWDVDNKVRLFISEEHKLNVRSLIWGHLQNRLISSDDGSVVRLWTGLRLTPGEKTIAFKQTINHHEAMGSIRSLALSLDETQLASGCANALIYIRNIKSANRLDSKNIKILSGHQDSVTSLAWNTTGLVSASDDYTVRIWDTRSGQCTALFQEHENRIKHVAWMPNGRHVISGGGGRSRMLCIWSSAQQAHISTPIDSVDQVTCVAPCGDYLASAGMNGAVLLWNIQTHPYQKLGKILMHDNAPVSQLAWSHDGRYLASLGEDRCIRMAEPGTVRDRAWGIIRSENTATWFNHMVWLSSPNHRHWLAAGSSDGSITIWDIDALIDTIPAPGTQYPAELIIKERDCAGAVQSIECSPIAFDPRNTTVKYLAVSIRNTMILWRIQETDGNLTYQLVSRMQHPEGGAVHLTWSPDGRFLASTDINQTLYVWNTRTWNYTKVMEVPLKNQHLLWIKVLDKCWLVLGTNDTIYLWDAPTNATWSTPTKRIDWGAEILGFDGPHFVMARKKGIYVINTTELISLMGTDADNPSIKVLNHDIWLQQCGLQDVKKLSSSTARFLEKNGAKMHVAEQSLTARTRRSRNFDFFQSPSSKRQEPVAKRTDSVSLTMSGSGEICWGNTKDT